MHRAVWALSLVAGGACQGSVTVTTQGPMVPHPGCAKASCGAVAHKGEPTSECPKLTISTFAVGGTRVAAGQATEHCSYEIENDKQTVANNLLCRSYLAGLPREHPYLYGFCSVDPTDGTVRLGIQRCSDTCTAATVTTIPVKELQSYAELGLTYYASVYPGQENCKGGACTDTIRHRRSDTLLTCDEGKANCYLQFAQDLRPGGSKSNGLSGGAIAGIAVGATAAVAAVAYWAWPRKAPWPAQGEAALM